MKIKEVLDLTQKMPLSEVSKQYLNIGEKPAREALKMAGCSSKKGVRGWFFEGEDNTILEKNIYEFSIVKANTRVKSNEKTLEDKKEVLKVDKNIKTNEFLRKRASFDIDKKLFSEMKIAAIKEDRNLYELMEDAIRMYLAEK